MGSKLAIAGESVTLGLTGLDRDQYGFEFFYYFLESIQQEQSEKKKKKIELNLM